MIPFVISFPGQSSNAIAATQTITATAGGGVILNGSLSPGPGRNLTPSATQTSTASTMVIAGLQPVELRGIARTVTVFATTSATNCIFTVTGLDFRGNVITATFVGASGGSTAATDSLATGSGTDFHVILAIKSSASVANFTVGTGATGVTNFCVMDTYKTPFNVTVGGNLTATTTTYTVQKTFDNVQTTTTPAVFANATVSAIATTSLYGSETVPCTAIRGSVSSNSATGGVVFQFIQAG